MPFTVEQFISVFEKYNQAIWPMQIFTYVLAVWAVFLLVEKKPQSNKIIASILAFFWIWMGAAYHLKYFSQINKAAIVFGALFLIQGLIFLIYGVIKENIVFDYIYDKNTVVGGFFILFGMVLYSVIGLLFGHVYPRSPIFGVAPCPTTIFTFGMLLFTKKLPKVIIIIPFLWSLLGFSAALKLGITEDVGLLIAGVTATIMIFIRDRNITAGGFENPKSSNHINLK